MQLVQRSHDGDEQENWQCLQFLRLVAMFSLRDLIGEVL
jgi:hypothetical protein